jgi:hypothetical protein
MSEPAPHLVLVELQVTSADAWETDWRELPALRGLTWSWLSDAEDDRVIDVQIRVASEAAGRAVAARVAGDVAGVAPIRAVRLVGVVRVLEAAVDPSVVE